MGTYSTFKTSSSRETEGICVDYGDAGRFRIARAGGSNKRFARKMQQLSRPHRRAIQADQLSEDLGRSLLMQAFVDTCLLGWEGVTGPNGEPLPFNQENALKLFSDLPDLFLDLVQQSQSMALFREEELEADLGN